MTLHTIDNINRKLLTYLTEEDYEACISLYMPVVKAGSQTRKNSIVFKDLCKRAEEKLTKYGIGMKEAVSLLHPLDKLAEDKEFWQDRPDGLAIFISPKQQLVFRAPVEFPVAAIVDKRFYIRPLLPLVQKGKNTHLALLGQKDAQLVNIIRHNCDRILPPEELRSLEAFLSRHEFEKSLQHTSSREAPHMHGQGTAGDEATENRYLLEYYKSFRNWLRDQLTDVKKLYLAGDDDSIGAFLKVSDDVPFELAPLIRKNIQSLDDTELLREAESAMEAQTEEEAGREFERFLQTRSNEPEKALADSTEKIVAAAHANQIETLFLPPEEERVWGHFNPANQNIVFEEKPEEGVGEELLNLAAIRTLRSGGAVFVNEAGENSKNAAAICHW